MTRTDIIIRILVSVIFSAMIGFEREKNRSNAGIKTHGMVGLAATLITITQVRISQDTFAMAQAFPEFASILRSDPARLTAQIVSGVGFLGAGTIIVTNKNISGLTTAASIWAVAAMGITVGMGFYDIAIIAFIAMISILFVVRRFVKVHKSEKLIIRYLQNEKARDLIKLTFEKHHINSKIVKYDVTPYGDELICTTHYLISSYHEDFFDRITEELSEDGQIVSIQTTNI